MEPLSRKWDQGTIDGSEIGVLVVSAESSWLGAPLTTLIRILSTPPCPSLLPSSLAAIPGTEWVLGWDITELGCKALICIWKALGLAEPPHLICRGTHIHSHVCTLVKHAYSGICTHINMHISAQVYTRAQDIHMHIHVAVYIHMDTQVCMHTHINILKSINM